MSIDVYVLDTGDRVISMRGAVKAITGKDAGNLGEYLSVQGLKGFIDKELVLVETRDFFIPGTQFRGLGITAEQNQGTLSGVVEVDGAYFGGHAKRENIKADRKDTRLSVPAKRQSVIVARERGGRTLTFVVAKEADGVALIRERVAPGSIVHADEAGGWDRLHALYDMRRINHSVAFSLDGACTNQAESYFSRLRRAEVGQHHHISGNYLGFYASEMAWREDRRRASNGGLHQAATAAALAHPVSRVWAGYWQR